MSGKHYCILLAALYLATYHALAQYPQDNWYQEQVWTYSGEGLSATNGGLSEPNGVAIGLDQRIYVADEGYDLIQVYEPDGAYAFSITNGFGGGLSFGEPKGMIFDDNGNLYVADKVQHSVFIFNGDGIYKSMLGGTQGTGDGQLSEPIDVAIGPDNEVYVLEYGNPRVSVFDTNGTFKRKWGEAGRLDGQLLNPLSIAVSRGGRVYICLHDCEYQDHVEETMKEFDVVGNWVTNLSTFVDRGYSRHDHFNMGGASVRIDQGGFAHVLISQFLQHSTDPPFLDHRPFIRVLNSIGSEHRAYVFEGADCGQFVADDFRFPCHAIGSDGTVVACSSRTKQLWVFRQAFRDQWAPPRNAIPMPTTRDIHQRSDSSLVDIDYRITDADDANVHSAILIFTNEAETISLGNCLRNPTLVEGTATNLGPDTAANEIHRVTWDPGTDWSVNLGDYCVAMFARDSRPGLLDVHYLDLPAANGMPALQISRSPLNENDYMQVWWWQLAINDPDINLATNQIVSASGVLCDAGSTTSAGRTYIHEKMNVRQASAQEVDWARQGNMPAGGTPNQWEPGRRVAERPMMVNEWGFDTGAWDTNSCVWIVPLD